MRLPLLMIIATFLVSIGIDAYITWDIFTYSRLKNIRRNTSIYIVSVVLCYALLIVAICLPRRSGDTDIIPIMWLLFTYLTIYVPKLVYIFFSAIGRLFRSGTISRPINYGAPVGLFIGLFVFISIWWGAMFTRHDIEVNEVRITSETLPDGFDGYRIAQFSDLHTGTWGNDTSFVAKMVKNLNGLNADMIIFSGDIVNRETKELKPFLEILSRLTAKDGVYAVRGNHDYGDYMDWPSSSAHSENNLLLGKWLRQMGWKVIDNDHDFITRGSDTISLIGVENWGEPPFKQYGDLKKSYPRQNGRSLNDSIFKILISHNPEHWNREVRKISNIDLTLAGHTHAMQTMLQVGDWKWSPAAWRYPQWGGLYTDTLAEGRVSHLYVNIGSGEVALPSRIGAVPEITLFTLSNKPHN